MSGNVQGVGAQQYPQEPVVITKQPIIQHVVNLECKRGVQQGLFGRVADFAVRTCIAGFTAGSMMAACRVAAAHVMGAPSQTAINEMVATSIGMGIGLGAFAAFTTSAKGDAALRGMEFGAAGAAVFMAASGNDGQVLKSAGEARDWVVLKAGDMKVEANAAFVKYVSEPFSTLEIPDVRLPDFFASEDTGFACPTDMVCVPKDKMTCKPTAEWERLSEVAGAREVLNKYHGDFAGFQVRG